MKRLVILFSFVLLSVLVLGYIVLSPNRVRLFAPVPPKRYPLNPTIAEEKPTLYVSPTVEADSPNTLTSPEKIMTSDSKHYFYYGAPLGQNNKKLKKIIFSLPGHGSTAESDYAAWKDQLISNGSYALSSLNWWDGKGESPQNYMSPKEVADAIKFFLSSKNYGPNDFVILEGFSRGSANTYPVVAYDRYLGYSSIDGVISASGKYQSDFAMTDELLSFNNGKLYENIPWILACGAKDENPTRDGCQGMEETRTFLSQKGANILKLLEDPNGAHGSFHKSPLKLAQQALSLFDSYILQH